MKLRYIIAMSLALLIGASATFRISARKPAEPGAEKTHYRLFGVAFYNLENLFDTINNNGRYDREFSPEGNKRWDGRKYRSKINRLGYAISQMATKTTPLGPALIGVSEIENASVLEDLVKADPIRHWQLRYVHHDSPDLRGVDVGLLYNPRFFKVIRVTNHRLSIPGREDFRTRDQMCVVGLLGGSRVAVIVNHWPSRRGGQQQSSWLREAAASLSRQIADSLYKVDPEMGIIVMGDLNDDPHDVSVAKTLGACRNAGDVAPGGFFNPFWEKLDKGIGSYVYHNGWDLFDQIIINSNLVDGACGLKFLEAEVINKDFLLQQDGQYKGSPLRTFSSDVWLDGYSDHLPTEIFLTKEVK